MNTVAVTEITITKRAKVRGSNMVEYTVDVDGVPFGLIWTFKAAGEVHPFHAKPLAGEHATFATYAEAETYMRGAI